MQCKYSRVTSRFKGHHHSHGTRPCALSRAHALSLPLLSWHSSTHTPIPPHHNQQQAQLTSRPGSTFSSCPQSLNFLVIRPTRVYIHFVHTAMWFLTLPFHLTAVWLYLHLAFERRAIVLSPHADFYRSIYTSACALNGVPLKRPHILR